MKLTDGNIVLRKWKDTDAQRLADIANNKKIYDNLRDALPHPYSLEDAKKYISIQLDSDNVTSHTFAIEVDGKVVGSIGAFIQNDIYRKNAEIGYFLDEKYWGKGIVTTAIKLIVNYVFENCDIIRIYAEPFSRNMASRRCLEKAGFKLEAELKKNVIKNDIIENSCIYALLKDGNLIYEEN